MILCKFWITTCIWYRLPNVFQMLGIL